MVLAGCGVTGNDGSDGAKQPAVTKAQLATMIVPADDLGASIQGLQVDESGVVDNKDAAENSYDPDDTGETMKGDGRVTGYELSYEHPKLIASKGALGAGTSVDLFQDPVYAAQFLHERLNDYERFKNGVPGLKFSRYSDFEAPAIGDEGAGQHLTITIPGVVTGYETEVVFRRGRIVALVAIARADRKDVREEALKLATELDRRIQAVLAGEIEVEPDRPEKSSTATAAELRKLPSLTLAPADIGPGVRVAKEGRRSGGDFHAYYRQFTDVTVGGSHLLTLRGETQLYESPGKAELALTLLGKQAGRQILTQGIVESVVAEAGVKPTNVRVRPLAGLGPGRTGTVVTFRLVGANFMMATIFTRSGRVVQAVMGMCRSTDFDPDDLEPVADRAGRRLAA
ncbi:MAG TPA: hypothetical protein VH650_13240 [Gaiellaceae bacterium]|jgi:hypothetical protein